VLQRELSVGYALAEEALEEDAAGFPVPVAGQPPLSALH
jgi:hypothetical protein